MVTGLRRLGLGASLGATLSVAFGAGRLFGTPRSALRPLDAPPVAPAAAPTERLPAASPQATRAPEAAAEPPGEAVDLPWDPAAGDRRSGVERRLGGRDDLVARIMQAKNRRSGVDRRGAGSEPGRPGMPGS